MTRAIETDIDIAASADRVWEVLTDFARYPEWNPFVKKITGAPEIGARLSVQIQPPGKSAMTFKPTVQAASCGRELRWLGSLGVRHLFDGEHAFLIEPTGNGHVRFRQNERFSGLLVPLVWSSMADSTKQGFELMNAALKTRAES